MQDEYKVDVVRLKITGSSIMMAKCVKWSKKHHFKCSPVETFQINFDKNSYK